ncbi:MAG: hypothetical protein ACK2U9_14715, partial [Anaerolineae bacterium]
MGDFKRSNALIDGALRLRGESAYQWQVRGELMVALKQKTDRHCFDKAQIACSDYLVPLETALIYVHYREYAKAQQRVNADPLHTEVFAPHLQGLLASQGVVGVDNGLFGQRTFPFSDEAHEAASRGDFRAIQQEKWARRERLATVLAAYQQQLAQSPRHGGVAQLARPD